MRELGKDFRHLVAAFAAADVDHDLGIRPLGQLLLGHGLATPERAGNCGCATFGNREETIKNTLTGDQGSRRILLFSYGTGDTDRPALDHRVLTTIVEDTDSLVNGEVPFLDRFDRACFYIGREHDLMDDVGFLNLPKDCSRFDIITCFNNGLEGPLLLMRKPGCRNTTFNEVAHLGHKHREGSLDPIVDTGQESRTEFNCERETGVFHRFSGTDTGGIFVYLDDDAITLDLDDFSHQRFFADLHHIIHVGVKIDCRNDRAGDSFENPLFLFFCMFFFYFHRSTPTDLLIRSLIDNPLSSPPIAITVGFTEFSRVVRSLRGTRSISLLLSTRMPILPSWRALLIYSLSFSSLSAAYVFFIPARRKPRMNSPLPITAISI